MLMFYIQDNWETEIEGDIIIEYCKTNNINFEILSKEDILELEYDENTPIIGDRDIISKILNDKTDTYDDIFKGLYGNIKTKTTFSYIRDPRNKIRFPIFIKPVTTKLFNGMILEKADLWNFEEMEIYISDILNLENEKRVLITKDKQIYSNGDIDETIKIKILERVTKYHVIDIAYCTNIGEWIIVENNPLFSIGLNDINEEDYISFIINSWKNIKLE